MKLIVGLGNPGSQYVGTRHNVGFSFIDFYLLNKNISDKWIKKNNSLYLITNIFNEKIIFLKPQTFMNLSGESVRYISNFYKIPIEDILIICDDLDLKIGNFKLKSNGSSGGHNGLKSIENNLNTSNYKRLKIGISKDLNYDVKDYVLSKFTNQECEILDNLFIHLCNVIDDFFSFEFNDLMSKYNKKNR